MLRTLQRVRPLGGCVTVVSTFVTVAVASDTGRPERGASSNPASCSCGKPAPPNPHGVRGGFQFGGNIPVLPLLGRQQNDAGAQNLLLGRTAILHTGVQLLFFRIG